MSIFEIIKRDFHTTVMGYRKVEDIADHLTFTFKDANEYGVAILNTNNVEIFEEFANVTIKSVIRNLQGYGELSLIELSSTLSTHRNEFAHICVQFIDLGDRGFNRLSIQNDPFEWWERWQQLIGNTISNRSVYSIVAELFAFYQVLIRGNESAKWQGPKASSHDIEAELAHYEVKATTTKYINEISISGQFQLESTLPLYLLFIKVEESNEGYSINDIVRMIEVAGYDVSDVEENLNKIGLFSASRKRHDKYKINEIRCYEVNESFPKITIENLNNERLKEHIKKISYVIDLSGLEFENWL